MPNFNKIKKFHFSKGFTLIELIVVIGIMAMLAGALTLNLNSGRSARNIVLAENELVAHIKEIQSYTLSSRALPSGFLPQYYILKFDLADPTHYKVQAIYDVNVSPKLVDIATVNFPQNIQLASSSAISITQRLASPATQTIPDTSSNCALLAFATPYGKPMFNSGCSPTSFTGIHTLLTGEDYQKFINFVTNVSCSADPAACTLSAGSVMAITLTDRDRTVSKTVTVNGITGAVKFN